MALAPRFTESGKVHARTNAKWARSYSMLRYPTLNATTSKCIVSNRYSRNCSTPNLKIVSGQGGSLHRIFCVIPELHVLEGAELGPMALALGMAKKLPHTAQTQFLKYSHNYALKQAEIEVIPLAWLLAIAQYPEVMAAT
jgi:hypothetical protein